MKILLRWKPMIGLVILGIVTMFPTKPLVQGNEVKSNLIWNGSFENQNWQKNWNLSNQKWGLENTALIPDQTNRFKQVLRVRYPAGSASPAVTRKGAPSGGAQFYSRLNLNAGRSSKNRLRLRYFLRFSNDFEFVKGGKLPGFYGGIGNSGGDIPNGSDGFSSRLMWRKNGAGEVYSYLPSSKDYGTSIGRGSWTFKPGIWHQVEQEIKLNDPTKSNGWVKVWIDNTLVLNQSKLQWRTDSNLTVDGIFFSTFFGGQDASWSTPKNVYIDFAEFAIVPNSR
jgi:hypothetical protein